MSNSLTDKACFWTVPIGGFIANFIAGGIAKSFGIIMKETQDLFNTNAAPLTLAGGLIYAFMYCLTIVGLLISQRFGSRITVSVGALGCILSFLGAFLSTSVTMWVISFGCGLGISMAFIYSPVFISLTRCFRKRIGIAIGITVAGSSVGQMIFPTFVSYAIEQYGVRSFFLVAAGMCFHLFLTAVLMPRYAVLEMLDKQLQSDISTSKGIDTDNANDNKNDNVNVTFTKIQIAMLVIFISARVFGDIGDIGMAFALPMYGQTKIELSIREISIAIGLSGCVDLVTRISVGLITDQKWCPRSLLLTVAWLIEGFNTIFLLWFPYRISYFVFYAIFGMSSGMAVTMMIVVLNDFVGEINFKKSFGVMTFVLGLVISPGQFLMGYITDSTGNYTYSMLFLGINLFIAFFIMTLEYPMRIILPSKKPTDAVDYSSTVNFNAIRALTDAPFALLGMQHMKPKSRNATFFLLSTIDAKEFLPLTGKRS